MAAKAKDPLMQGETAESGGGVSYEECTVKIIGMELHEKKNPVHPDYLVQNYDNVMEFEFGVREGEYAGQSFKYYSFVKTQKGEWACYEGKPRPILREILDRVREFEGKDEVFEGEYFPGKMLKKEFRIGLKHVESKKNGREYWFVETGRQKVQDEKKDAEYKASQELADDASRRIGEDEEEINPEDLPF